MRVTATHPRRGRGAAGSVVEQLRAAVSGDSALLPTSGFPSPPAPLSLAHPSRSSPQPTQALLYMKLPIAGV